MRDKNREIVQRGLDLRRAKRKAEAAQKAEAAMDAAYEAAGMEMRAEINFYSRFHEEEKKVAWANQCRDAQTAERRATRRAQDRKRAQNWNIYLMRNVLCVLVSAASYGLNTIGVITELQSLPVMILAFVYCFVNYSAYMNRNGKTAENRKKVAA